jgi:hypothetical protein
MLANRYNLSLLHSHRCVLRDAYKRWINGCITETPEMEGHVEGS